MQLTGDGSGRLFEGFGARCTRRMRGLIREIRVKGEDHGFRLGFKRLRGLGLSLVRSEFL